MKPDFSQDNQLIGICYNCKKEKEVRVLFQQLYLGRLVGSTHCCSECWPKPISIYGEGRNQMSRNNEVLKDFVEFCEQHPDLRFWQALLTWSGLKFIVTINVSPDDYSTEAEGHEMFDTYLWEGRNQ